MKFKERQSLVYIILVNWDGLDDTLECLASLNKIDYKNYRIMVVDNGSKNNQANIIKERFPKIELIKNKENKGFVIANNQGIEQALKNNTDYILLLNNDTVVKRNFLDVLIEYAEQNRDVGILSPKIVYYNSNIIWSMGGKISYLTGFSIMIGKGGNSENYNEVIEPDFVSGCAMLIRNEVIEKIGLLDPVYFAYYEDADYCFRVGKLGYKIKVIPESIIWHKKSASAGLQGSDRLTPIQAYYFSRNALIFAKKNLRGFKKALFISAQFTLRLLYNLVQSQNNQARLNYLKGLYTGLRVGV